ncbi:MAG: L,D-transpeptidase [Chlorobi bacterium]|nr:L,D-transpeptidase [Chlorobiota bacterium]
MFRVYISTLSIVLWLGTVANEIFASESNISDAGFIAAWVMKTGDNERYPFIILDKKIARLFVYTSEGDLVGDAPVLLGMSTGDILPDGIAGKPLSKIPEKDRITQAGRFFARKGYDNKDKVVLWVDYATQLAIHEVVNVPNQRRLERLASPTPTDNRISWGCINVPVDFFYSTLMGTFSSGKGYVYILPEQLPLAEYFGIK